MVATIVHGERRTVVPEDVRRDLGLEDGAEYVLARTEDAPVAPPSTASIPVPSMRSTDEQIEAMERVFGSLRRYVPRAGPVLTDDDWDEAIAQAIVEDFLNEDSGDQGARD